MKQIKATLSDDEAEAISQAIDDELTAIKSNGYDDDSYSDYQRHMNVLKSAGSKLDL